MANVVNGQLILEEEYDENYQPTEQGITFYTRATNLKFTQSLRKDVVVRCFVKSFFICPKT